MNLKGFLQQTIYHQYNNQKVCFPSCVSGGNWVKSVVFTSNMSHPKKDDKTSAKQAQYKKYVFI